MAAAAVIPLRWTARGFVRAGVVFTIRGSSVSVAGPPNRTDLLDALRSEVIRRADVFAKFKPIDRSIPWPRVRLPGVIVARDSRCDSCGDALDNGRGGMCPLCAIALQRVLRAEGRI